MSEKKRVYCDDSHGNVITDEREYLAAKRFMEKFPELSCTLTLAQVAIKLRDFGWVKSTPAETCPVCMKHHAGAPITYTFHIAWHEWGDKPHSVCWSNWDHSYLATAEQEKRFATRREVLQYIAGIIGGDADE